MSKFPDRPKMDGLRPEEVAAAKSDSQLYTLLEDFIYISDLIGTVIAPKGLVTNFASIPRPVWNILSPEDPCIMYGSIIHDAIYSAGGRFQGRAPVTREEADLMLREAMGVCGAPAWKKFFVYHALRIGGGGHWK